MKKDGKSINKTMLVFMNTDDSIKRNKNHLRLPSISSILTWHSELNPTSSSSLLFSSSSSSPNLSFQKNNPSTTSLSSKHTLPPLLLSNSLSSLTSQFNHHHQHQQHQHHPVKYQYNSNNVDPFYTSHLNRSTSTFIFKSKLSTYPIHDNNNNNNNTNINLQSTRKIRRSNKSKVLTRASSLISLSGNLKSQPSTSTLSASMPSFHPDHLNNNNDNNSNHMVEDIIMIDDNNNNRSMSISSSSSSSPPSSSSSSSSSSSTSSNVSNSLIKPRWRENERLNLLKAIVKEKKLDDMASFSWDKIAVAVGRAKKACKDQWRREILPAIMKNIK